MSAVIVFIFGLMIGSFLNVCIYRIPKNRSIVFPASHCPKCGKNIFWYDNVPILSFLILGGKCRFCKAKISFKYLLVEALTAALLTALFVHFGMTPRFFAYSVMACGLVVATFIDFEIQEIPDEISLGGIAAGILLALVFPSIFGQFSRMHSFLSSAAGVVAGAGSIFALKISGTFMFRKKVKELGLDSAMGDGDVKLMAMIGAFVGLKLVLLTFFIAPFLGVIPGLISKIKKGADTIPYGPFLSAAALVAVFFGEKMLGLFF